MIPKIIHHCWFGGKPLPPLALSCINSWKKFFPDYEIKEWNEKNFDVNQIKGNEEKVFSPYTRHEKKPNNVLYVLVYVLIVILAVFAVFWAVKQITVNTRVASEISYKE